MATRENAPLLIVLLAACWLPVGVVSQTMPNGAAIDGEVSKIMTQTHANGLAVAVIDHGKVSYVHSTASATPREIRSPPTPSCMVRLSPRRCLHTR